jgi:hypothetical protein
MDPAQEGSGGVGLPALGRERSRIPVPGRQRELGDPCQLKESPMKTGPAFSPE